MVSGAAGNAGSFARAAPSRKMLPVGAIGAQSIGGLGRLNQGGDAGGQLVPGGDGGWVLLLGLSEGTGWSAVAGGDLSAVAGVSGAMEERIAYAR